MTIDDLFLISKGKKPPELFDAPSEGSIAFIKIEAIRNAGNHQYCAPSPNLVTCNQDDVLIVWDGAYCGLTGFGLQGAIGSTLARLRPKAKDVFGPYAGHFLKAKFKEIQENATGAAIPHINGGHLRRMEIPLPPPDEQRRIAAVLDQADTLRHQREESIQLTEQLLQSVFIDMFGDPMANPKGWPMIALGSFGVVQTGNTPPRSNRANYSSTGIEWIKTDNIVEDRVIATSAAERLSETGAKVARIAPAGSLLVACIAGSEKSIGRAALTDRKVAFNQQINAISPFPDTSPLFLYFLIKMARRHIQSAAAKGMKKIINKSTFEQLKFIAPDLDLQQRFEKIAQRMLFHGTQCRDQHRQLDLLFSSLQQRAFRGKLDLSKVKLGSAEPAAPKLEVKKAETVDGIFHRPGYFPTPPELEAEMQELEDFLMAKSGDSISWNENYFKYRTLSQVLRAPFTFQKIWAQVYYDMAEANYDDVKDKIFEYVEKGILRQRFCKKSKEIVFFPKRK